MSGWAPQVGEGGCVVNRRGFLGSLLAIPFLKHAVPVKHPDWRDFAFNMTITQSTIPGTWTHIDYASLMQAVARANDVPPGVIRGDEA
jgi:hypothetical protein